MSTSNAKIQTGIFALALLAATSLYADDHSMDDMKGTMDMQKDKAMDMQKDKAMEMTKDKTKDMKMDMQQKMKSDKALIISAESAAPKALSKNATIVAMNADGSMRTLRQGTNGFTCMPDMDSTPGPDPMCYDQNSAAWVQAWIEHKVPPAGKVGFMYMLQGGVDASNTDPYAEKPANGKWLKTGPHVMVVGADASFYAGYPSGPTPDTKQPYVMWAGTPYQHLMAPVE